MLSDAELQQMLADAERIEALRSAAIEGPWTVENFGYDLCEAKITSTDGSLIVESTWWENGDFIVATRTDPSAANVLRLVEEYQVMRSALLKIRHLSRNRNAKIDDAVVIAKLAIGTKAVKGVPVPEHLKAYEEEGE